jgi:hypothetical protein
LLPLKESDFLLFRGRDKAHTREKKNGGRAAHNYSL